MTDLLFKNVIENLKGKAAVLTVVFQWRIVASHTATVDSSFSFKALVGSGCIRKE
jgi:hypothetical protein